MLPTSAGTATATAAGTVTWSFASPTPATPPAGTSSTTGMDVVPGPMIIVQRYEYTGRELASESGEYYFRFRVYGPDLGQFFTRDPLGYWEGTGLYAGHFTIQAQSQDPYGLVVWTDEQEAQLSACARLAEKFQRRMGGLKNMIQAGCIKEPPILCVCCGMMPAPVGDAWWDPSRKQIIACFDKMPTIWIVLHEYQHAFDNCLGADFSRCEHHACSEIRAYFWNQCWDGAPARLPNESRESCAAREAVGSVLVNYPNAQRCVDAVKARCMPHVGGGGGWPL